MREIVVKSVLNKKKKRDSWFLDDYTLNPYEGCSFNCQYCYIRGSKYGENMEGSLAVKVNAPEVLNRQLAFRARKDQRGIIVLASATDPYLPAEKDVRMTERLLPLILEYRFPLMLITKSELVLRDIDILKEIDRQAIHAADLRGRLTRGVVLSFSLSTLDEQIASTLEPGAPPPAHRLRTMRACKEAGLMVGVNLIPVLPYISDTEEQLDEMIRTVKSYGADYVFVGGLTLFGSRPADSKTLYYHFLERRFPELLEKYENFYRDYFSPPRFYSSKIRERAARICEKYDMPVSLMAQL